MIPEGIGEQQEQERGQEQALGPCELGGGRAEQRGLDEPMREDSSIWWLYSGQLRRQHLLRFR